MLCSQVLRKHFRFVSWTIQCGDRETSKYRQVSREYEHGRAKKRTRWKRRKKSQSCVLWIHLNRRLISHTQARPVYGNVRAYVKFNLFYLFVVFFLHHFSIFFAICRLFCFISFVHFFSLCCFAWVFIVYVRIPHRFSHVYLTTLLLLCFNIYMYLCNSFRFHSIFHLYIYI